MGDAMSVQERGNRYWVEKKGNLGKKCADSGLFNVATRS